MKRRSVRTFHLKVDVAEVHVRATLRSEEYVGIVPLRMRVRGYEPPDTACVSRDRDLKERRSTFDVNNVVTVRRGVASVT